MPPPAGPYNPYVTVDYVDMSQVDNGGNTINDARPYNSQGQNSVWTIMPANPMQGPNLNSTSDPHNRYSFGRNQPYGAVESLPAPAAAPWQQQVAPASPPPPQPAQQPTENVFRRQCGRRPVAPDWLVHLDRPLISPVELLNVSAFKPHELTQQFYKDAVTGALRAYGPVDYLQRGRHFDAAQNFLLYRLLEFVKTDNATPGVVDGGRVPGKININTLDPINALAVFQAIADREAGNTFSDADVQTIFSAS